MDNEEEKENLLNMLTYKRYKNAENIISIDLHNDYSVIAVWSYDSTDNHYDTTLFLKEKTIDKLDLIKDDLIFYATRKTINSAILKQVATYLDENFFEYYIQRYEYDLKCCEIGDEEIKKEQFLNAS